MATTYTFQANLKNNRPQAAEFIGRFFSHVDWANINVTAVSFSAATGTVTVTVQTALPADQLSHFGLA